MLKICFAFDSHNSYLSQTSQTETNQIRCWTQPGYETWRCLFTNNQFGRIEKEETAANQARKHLTKFADDLTEENRKATQKEPFPNLYTYQDDNCVGKAQDPPKRDRRMRRS